jgi:hypothetical protein
MQPTRVRLLIGVSLVTGALGWGIVQVVASWSGRLAPVPWLAAAALWIMAAALAYWTVLSRPRLQGRPGAKPLAPIVAARSAALAMAASRIGAVMLGLYAGVAIAMAGRLGTATGAQAFWSATVAALGALGIVAAALWLERTCRIPLGRDDEPRP